METSCVVETNKSVEEDTEVVIFAAYCQFFHEWVATRNGHGRVRGSFADVLDH